MKLVKRTYMGEREIFLLPPSPKHNGSFIKHIERMGWDNDVSLQQHRNMNVRKVDPVLGRSSPSRAKIPQYKRIIKGLRFVSLLSSKGPR